MKGEASWYKGLCRTCRFGQVISLKSRWRFWLDCKTALLILLLLALTGRIGCGEVLPADTQYSITGLLDSKAYAIYELELDEVCHDDAAFLNVQLVDQNRITQQPSHLRPSVLGGAPAPTLLPHWDKELANLTWDDVGNYVATNATGVSLHTFRSFTRQFWMYSVAVVKFQHVAPWYVGVINAARQVPLTNTFSSPVSSFNYSIRAWCTESPSCPLECGGHGACGQNGICTCDSGWTDDDCRVELKAIVADSKPVVGNVEAGEWDHYLFQGTKAGGYVDGGPNFERNGNFLVELQRLSGDPVLFAKPLVGGVRGDLKPYFKKSVDGYNYLNRFNFHYLFLRNVTFGDVIIGVFNDKAESQTPASYSITVRVVPVGRAATLCPRNCSWPNGVCASDGTLYGSICRCAIGFEGRYCQGELRDVELEKPLSGLLSPGEIIYFRYDVRLTPGASKDLGLSFSLEGGNGAVVAKHNGTPALNDNDMRFLYDDPNADGQKAVRIERAMLVDGVYTFAIFNSDYSSKGDLEFKLLLSAIDPIRTFILSPLLSTLIGIVSSAVLFLGAFSFKRCFSNQRPDSNTGMAMDSLDAGMQPWNEERTLQRGLTLTFPLITVKRQLADNAGSISLESSTHGPKTYGQCAVCLNDYNEGELLQLLPCHHAFHSPCIDAWLSCHATCPVCRISFPSRCLALPCPGDGAMMITSGTVNSLQYTVDSDSRGRPDLERWSESLETNARPSYIIPLAFLREGGSGNAELQYK